MASSEQHQVKKTRINIRNCVFGFRCAQNWDAMQETSRDDVRFCKECAKDVYWVSNKDMLLEAIAMNHCIAIESPKDPTHSRDKPPEVLLGMIRSYEDENGEPEPKTAFRERLRNKKVT